MNIIIIKNQITSKVKICIFQIFLSFLKVIIFLRYVSKELFILCRNYYHFLEEVYQTT